MYVILADDQVDVRSAVRCLLQDEPQLPRMSDASNAPELLAQMTEEAPDLVLLDWELPGMSMSDLLAAIRVLCPSVKIVALSVHPEACAEAELAGVQGFASKGDPPERLLAAVRHALPCVQS